MSKQITVDPALFSLSGGKSKKLRKKFNSTQKNNGSNSDMNYKKLLAKLKQMKKNKLQEKQSKNTSLTTNASSSAPSSAPCTIPTLSTAAPGVSVLANPVANPVSNTVSNTASDIVSNTVSDTLSDTLSDTVSDTVSNTASDTIPSVLLNPPINLGPLPPTSPNHVYGSYNILSEEVTEQVIPSVVAETPVSQSNSEPLFGNLKGGNKPTYRQYKSRRQTRKLRTTTKKYRLGRDKSKNKISVLLKNNKTRKKVKNDIQTIKQKSIKEIRAYLQEKNIIKAGSMAPNNVLRKMYEDLFLSGNVENINSENLIHNYMNEDNDF